MGQGLRMSELVDIMAPAEHSGPVALYAAASHKCRADLIRHSDLQEAVVLACAMSSYTAALVLGSTGDRWSPQLETLRAALACSESVPARNAGANSPTRVAGDRDGSDAGWRRRVSNRARRLLPEEMVWRATPEGVRGPRVAGPVDWHGSRSAIQRAIATLPSIAGSSTQWSCGNRPFAKVSGQPDHPMGHAAVEDLAHAVRLRIFQGSAQAPDSVFTLALYAYQTLIVHRPEAYALAGVEGHAAAALARRLRGVDALLAWMRRHVVPGSIFPEEDRVMLPDQVATYGLGRPLDRALLIFAVARRLGLGARVVQTTRGAYALVNDGSGPVLIDAGALRPVSAPQGVVVLAFDEARQVGYGEAWAPPEPTPCPRAVLPARLPRRPVAAASVA